MAKTVHTDLSLGIQEAKHFQFLEGKVVIVYGMHPAYGVISGTKAKFWFTETAYIINDKLGRYVYEMLANGASEIVPDEYVAPAPKKTERQLLREENIKMRELLSRVSDVLGSNKRTIQRLAGGNPKAQDDIDWIDFTLTRIEEAGVMTI